ncbi:MAG: hypothetical protein JWO25_1544 [Alphaproteobacteria bacterium]|nr:hypothetical protein [Alphaproteobacteria bacterium]
MNYYRLYYVKGGHFAGFDGFSADDDVLALRQAEGIAETRHAELWCGKRKVKILNRELGTADDQIPSSRSQRDGGRERGQPDEH